MPVFFVSRPKKIYTCVLIFLLLLMSGTAFYSYFVEPNNVGVEQITIRDAKLYQAWGEIKIAHISDLHVGVIGRREARALDILKVIRPDLIVVSGDLTQWNDDPDGALSFISRMEASLGVFCVLGDSDLSTGRKQCIFCHSGGNPHSLRKHPSFFKNGYQQVSLPGRDNKLLIAGVFPKDIDGIHLDVWLNGLPQGNDPVLVLSHFSLPWKTVMTARPLLWLSGDNHGGQIVMPDFIWKTFSGKPDKEHKAGLFRQGEHKWLYVNRGLGLTRSFPFRLGVPPEITVFSFIDEAGAGTMDSGLR